MSAEYPLLSPEQREERRAEALKKTQRDGMLAAGITSLGVIGLHFAAKKHWPRWQRFPLSPRIFWLSSAVVAAYVIVAEKSHLKYLAEIQDYDARALQAIDDAKLYSSLTKKTPVDANTDSGVADVPVVDSNSATEEILQ